MKTERFEKWWPLPDSNWGPNDYELQNKDLLRVTF